MVGHRKFSLTVLETYNDDFFEALDGVTNALDNVDASKYSTVSFILRIHVFPVTEKEKSTTWSLDSLNEHLGKTDTYRWSLAFFTPYIWLSVRRTTSAGSSGVGIS